MSPISEKGSNQSHHRLDLILFDGFCSTSFFLLVTERLRQNYSQAIQKPTLLQMNHCFAISSIACKSPYQELLEICSQ